VTVVLVHGNPETAGIWDPLVDALGARDVVRLSLPGFGAPIPPGWRVTPTAYRDWLAAEIEALAQPVDLVGHDWGGAHVAGVAMTRPELLRSWCTDSIGWFAPDYAWHTLARAWQTPGVGEPSVAAMTTGGVQDRAGYLTSIGVPASVAELLARGSDQVSGQCVLELYRSAAQLTMTQLGQHLPAASRRPGLVLLATLDRATETNDMRRAAAARAGAHLEVFASLGHWWMIQDPHQAANLLQQFWDMAGQEPSR